MEQFDCSVYLFDHTFTFLVYFITMFIACLGVSNMWYKQWWIVIDKTATVAIYWNRFLGIIWSFYWVINCMQMLFEFCVRKKKIINQILMQTSFDIPTTLLGQVQCFLLTIMCRVVWALPSGIAGADPNEQLESSCFADAVVAFCKLQHLDLSISMKMQVSLHSTWL